MFKKTICLLTLIILVTSCAENLSAVKRGLTGAKSDSADEFLVRKKDPLILPPDFESLPSPAEEEAAREEMSSFEESLKKITEDEGTSSSTGGSVENSIMKRIKNK